MSKTVILMRHGKRTDAGLLTPEGEEQVAKTADKMIAAGIRPDAIYCSKHQRSKKSAEILAGKFMDAGIEVSLNEDNRLKCGPLVDVIGSLNDKQEHTVIMVGHQGTIWDALKILTYKPLNTLSSGEALILECPDRPWKDVSISMLNSVVKKFSP